MRTTIVLPTYNESDNIRAILDALVMQQVPDLSVIVVDDSSPDGTGALVEEYAKTHSIVSLYSRTKKEGLGRAYIAGFTEAIRRGAECIIQMDADLSHDPNDIPRFVNHLQNADLVVGSRYLHGGRVKDWAPHRFWLSWSANKYARLLTRAPIYDLTGGFKAWRRELLEKMDLPSIAADGYGFQIEMNYRAWKNGARIDEIPIVFEERREGKSKMSKHIIWEALWLVWKLRFGK